MSYDLTIDIFKDTSYGKVALRKFNSHRAITENFRIYFAGWLGNRPEEWEVMEIRGAEFRPAKKGRNKGKLCVKLPGTDRKTYVLREEMDKESKSE